MISRQYRYVNAVVCERNDDGIVLVCWVNIISLTHILLLPLFVIAAVYFSSLFCSDDVGRAAADSFRLQVGYYKQNKIKIKTIHPPWRSANTCWVMLSSSSALLTFYTVNGRLPVR